MVRAGIALYGYHPAGAESGGEEVGLVPAMSFSSRVLQVKNLPAGSGISYGHTFKTKTDTKIAVIPVGYEDGYRRSLSNKGCVLVRGEYAPVVGRVCMNMCMVDVSRIEAVQPGDEVVLLGSQNEKRITADDLAVKGDTISYEILCNLGNSNNRQYIA
jgi:alanine racemase